MLTLLLFYMHRENIKRLQAGTEGRSGRSDHAVIPEPPRVRLAAGREAITVLAYRSSASSTNRAAASASGIGAKRRDHLHADRQSALGTWAETLTQGTPINVHSRLKRGSPVDENPFGAAPGAENVSKTSTSSNISASALRARLATPRACIIIGRRDALALVERPRNSGGIAS